MFLPTVVAYLIQDSTLHSRIGNALVLVLAPETWLHDYLAKEVLVNGM